MTRRQPVLPTTVRDASSPRRVFLPPPAVQTAAWTALGTIAGWWLLQRVGLPATGLHPALLGVLLAASVLTSRLDVSAIRPLRRQDHEERLSLHEGSLVLFLVVLPPGWAWLLVVLGYALGSLGQARGMKYPFNIGLWATTVAVAVALHEAIAAGPTTALSVRGVVALAVAVLAHLVGSLLAVQLVMGAATSTPLGVRLASTWAVQLGTWVGNLLLGITAASLWLQTPWLSPVALGLGLVLRGAYRQAVEARRVLDDVRLDRDRLDLITESSALGVVLLDHDGTVTVWNRSMTQLTGITAEDARGRHVDDVLRGRVQLVADRARLPHSLAAATSEESVPAPAELTLSRTDGERRVVQMTHTPQRDALGGVARVVVQLRDLTAQREADRLQDDFLARVTHELRTPLTSIIGFGRTLQHKAERLPPATREDLARRLVGAGETLERLVDDLLLVSPTQQPRRGRTPRRLHPQPLAALVDAAVEQERAAHRGRVVEVEHRTSASAVVDAAWLTTVVRHLVDNALQYSPDFSPVRVEVEEAEEHALVRVVDHGRGIPPSKLPSVFERFTRVEEPLRMETRGAGLGLFIVDRLVARMGGHVEVDSALGEGSTFTVWLPLSAPDLPSPPPHPVRPHQRELDVAHRG